MKEAQLPVCPLPRRERRGKNRFSLSDFRALLTRKIICQHFHLTNLWLDIRRAMFSTKQGLLCPLSAGFVGQICGVLMQKKSRFTSLQRTRLHRVNIYFREEDGLKVNKYIRISSEYIFLHGRLCNQAVCKTLPAEAVLFFGFYFKQHPQKSCQTRLWCQLIFCIWPEVLGCLGFFGGMGRRTTMFWFTHTIPESSHFTEFSGNEHTALENPPLRLGLCQL